MYEIIKEQFDSGKALSQSKYYDVVKRDLFPKFIWDLYPLVQDYYHELNPFFLFNMYRPDFFRFAKTITVRDGYLTFASFILSHFNNLAKLEAGQFLIHPELAKLVPNNVNSQFSCWQIVQKKQIELSQAKKVIVFGFVCDQYLGSIDELKLKLKELEVVSPDASIELYLPIRRNVFDLHHKESVLIHMLMDAIKDLFPNRKFKILTSENFFEITNFKNTFVFDLAIDNMMVSDNYLHYYVQSRGASVNNNSLTKAPEDSVFSLDLSLHHELHVTPLPKVKNVFTDLLFYKKENPGIKDLNFDPLLQSMLRDLFKK